MFLRSFDFKTKLRGDEYATKFALRGSNFLRHRKYLA